MKTYEEILGSMLEEVPSSLDKREGSVIYTTLAPAAAQIAELYTYLELVADYFMPDSARGADLDRICGSYKISRFPSSAAKYKAAFTDAEGKPVAVPLGSRFRRNELIYYAETELEAGKYCLACETLGDTGVELAGALLPIDTIPDLTGAQLLEQLFAGIDTESDDSLRARLLMVYTKKPFGGNVAEYETAILSQPGVGDCKIFPAPNGEKGRVHCVITSENGGVCSAALIQSVKELLDPVAKSGEGAGLAPIGHFVTVATPALLDVTITAKIEVRADYEKDAVIADVTTAVKNYVHSMGLDDEVLYLSRVFTSIVEVKGISDVSNVMLNGVAVNKALPKLWNNMTLPRATVNLTVL